MDFQPPFILFCTLGVSAMIVSVLLAIAAEKFDGLLDRHTRMRSRRCPQHAVQHAHAEVTHLL